MADIKSLIRKNIIDLVPYSSARNEYKGEAKIFLDANENPFDGILHYNRYPDPQQEKLKGIISKKHHINPKNIFLSNGSDEAIDIIIRIFCEPMFDSILTFSPGFGMFKVAASINNVGYKSYPLDSQFRLDYKAFRKEITSDVKVVFLCSPNNPTGTSLDITQIENLCMASEAIIVVDEAYIHFSQHRSMIDKLSSHNNLIVLQTMSKAYGGAGLRIGMAFADPQIINYMNNVKMPYNISSSNQEEAIKLLMNNEQQQKVLDLIREEKDRMWIRLNSYSGIKHVYPSDANFFLIKVEDAGKLYSDLIAKEIIVRNLSSKKGCEDCLRITVGTKNQNNSLYEVMDTLLQ